jgi:DNA-directed RNA polymerase specialized sigma24 family protein
VRNIPERDFAKNHASSDPVTGEGGIRTSSPEIIHRQRLHSFNEYRPLLFAIAYRMLGSSSDAEDILQETFIRWQQTPEVKIESPRALLVTILTRLAINHLQSARVKREVRPCLVYVFR